MTTTVRLAVVFTATQCGRAARLAHGHVQHQKYSVPVMHPHPHAAAAAAALRDSALDATLEPVHTLDNGHATRVHYASLRDASHGQRVNKWDAQILDGEILALLKVPFRSMFSLFEPRVVESIKPEIDALLGVALFVFSTGLRRPTPGMKLENVQYPPELLTRKKVGALFVLSVGLPYVWKRVFRYLSLAQWNGATRVDEQETRRSRFLAFMKRLETLAIACQLANLLLFLKNGMYRSLPERVLGLQLRSIVPTAAPRMINFEYMTRQLLWDGLMEFGSFVLPFLTWSRMRASATIGSSPSAPSASQCTLCGISPPQTPYLTSCKHVYCYYCLQTAVAVNEDFSCAACGVQFERSERLQHGSI